MGVTVFGCIAVLIMIFTLVIKFSQGRLGVTDSIFCQRLPDRSDRRRIYRKKQKLTRRIPIFTNYKKRQKAVLM